MMPLGDDNSLRRTAPVVNYLLIILNLLFFLLEMAGGEPFIMNWAFIPKRFSHDPMGDIPTIFTSMFMHAGLLHLAGNMLYLWIFGDNVEDYLGKFKYISLYIFSGIAAIFAQYLFFPNSDIPNIGASGAIAGVLGAYLLFFPKQKVSVLVGRAIVDMPAIVVIGFWIIIQVFSGAGVLFSTQDTGGVAYMAHIGGFVAGFCVAILFKSAAKN